MSVGRFIDLDGFIAFLRLDNSAVLQLCFLEVMSDGRTVVTAGKRALGGVPCPTAFSSSSPSDRGAAAGGLVDQADGAATGPQGQQVLYLGTSAYEAQVASEMAGQGRDVAAAGREEEEKSKKGWRCVTAAGFALLLCVVDICNQGQRAFLESRSAFPSLPFPQQRASSQMRSPSVCPVPLPSQGAQGAAARCRPVEGFAVCCSSSRQLDLEVVSCARGISVQLFL